MRNVTKWSLATAACAVLIASQLSSVTSADDTQPTDNQPADAPATQPTTRPDRRVERGNRPDRGWGMREIREARDARDRQGGFMQGRPPGETYRNDELPSEEDWDEMTEFMKVNSPVRLEMYDKLASTLGSDSRWAQSARRRIAGRYRDMQSMKDRHPDMYDFAFKQVVLEDQILGTMRDLRTAADEDALRAKLRTQVSAYVDNFLNERESRLKKLREMVEKETQTIEHDRGAIDELVDKQLDRFQNEMSRLIEFSEDPEKWRKQNTPNP